MKYRLTISPAIFTDNLVSVTYPHTPFLDVTLEAKTLGEIESAIKTHKSAINHDAMAFIMPLDRKLRGFDKWKENNRALLQWRAQA